MAKCKCSFCNNEDVKLWRPYMDSLPLICASCAEKRQADIMYDEVNWRNNIFSQGYIGDYTGKQLLLPRWEVDDLGLVPSYQGPGPDKRRPLMTDQLIVNLKGVSENCSSSHTTMIPAICDVNGDFFEYTSIPLDCYKRWIKIPTR